MRSPNLLALAAAGVVLVGANLVPAALRAAPVAHATIAASAGGAAPDSAPKRRGQARRAETGRGETSRGGTTRRPENRTAAAVLRTSRAVLGAARLESGAQGLRVQRALARLGSRVNTSDRDALRMAFRAYYNYRAAHPENVRKPYLYFVDYGLDAETPRGYVFDMSELRIVEGPFTVAHGRGSAARGGVPRRFSNRHGSEATSLGLFVAQETYSFSGRTGGRAYNSIGLRLRGVSGRFNARARERGVVVHGAPYVTRDGAGRSEGCPAVSPARARTVIPRIRNGGMVFLYSPHDRAWKSEDPWANHGKGRG
ncbi:MAG TPA: murein L,D-transpeptidase catalytic domain family protein [Longimicrobium sp.]|nr:murein L,D-transpeptidase catalytic domain family protein [Longimicrobium sp.]